MTVATHDTNPRTWGLPARRLVCGLVLLSGMAALSWEVMWQLQSTLALGVSAWGAALTLALTMGGMCVGALGMGALLRHRRAAQPLRIYAGLEIVVGLCGLLLPYAFDVVEAFDTTIYATMPSQAPLTHILSIAAVLGVPTLCLGATLPVLGLMARQCGVSLATLYGFNTLGAAGGVLLAGFVLIPALGLAQAIWFIAGINIVVGLCAWMLAAGHAPSEAAATEAPRAQGGGAQDFGRLAFLIVFVTGFATFVLEVAWFRSLTAAFFSTTEAFAIMLAAVLLALALGAAAVPLLKRKQVALGVVLGLAGIFILLATPIIERIDTRSASTAAYSFIAFMQWFGMTFYATGAPMLLLGVALPWILDDQSDTRRWGALYGVNALAAMIGAVCAAWVFLPAIGFARTAWMIGGLVTIVALVIMPRAYRVRIGLAALVALAVAVIFESGIGRTRVQGMDRLSDDRKLAKILQFYEGPDVTVTAVEDKAGRRSLYIDGFSATEQETDGDKRGVEHYMQWMGHLPMLLHPDPKTALVICFGTGQTANALRRENPESLRIVDINKNVFKLAPHFPANEGVLDDPRVKATAMDGRAFVRRTDEKFDVITLEPMPPTFAGVNALYSQEFYKAARARMTADGVIAQWMPFHLVSPRYSAAIAKTMQSVFPNSIMWFDYPSQTGIILGSMDDDGDLGREWPGFMRHDIERTMKRDEVERWIIMDREAMARYTDGAPVITDNNQLLSYGEAAHDLRTGRTMDRLKANKAVIEPFIERRDQ